VIGMIENFGRKIIIFSEEFGRIILLFFATIKQVLMPPLEVRNTFGQMLEIGVRSLPVVIVTAIFTGMVFA